MTHVIEPQIETYDTAALSVATGFTLSFSLPD